MRAWLEKIVPAQAGDMEAFDAIVREFQDMAVGFAYSVLRDFDLAEDAAQDAFIEAFRDLSNLREPKAFPGWFRRILLGRCNRLTRSKGLQTIGLEHAENVAASGPTPAEAAQQSELSDRVMAAIASLPDAERTAVTLFYINGYSHAEVGEFLDQTPSTIKSRLHTARGRLRERMKDMARDEMDKVSEALKSRKPGKEFSVNVFKEIPLERWWTREAGGHSLTVKTYWMEGTELVAQHQGDPDNQPTFGLNLGGSSWDNYRVSLEYLVKDPQSGATIQLGPRGHGIFCLLLEPRPNDPNADPGPMPGWGFPLPDGKTSQFQICHWNKMLGGEGFFEHLAMGPYETKVGEWRHVELLVTHNWVGGFMDGREILRCKIPFPEPNYKYPTSTQGNLGLTLNSHGSAQVRVRNMAITFLTPTVEQIRELQAHTES